MHLSLITLALILPLHLLANDRAAQRTDAGKLLDLRVEAENWKGASQADLKAVFLSASSELTAHLDPTQDWNIEPIRIRHDKSGPIVLFQRSLRGELIVQLNSKGTHWAQHAYQFSHEFCHILCRFKQGDPTNLWFEEALCELASIYSLQQMAITWQTNPPYPNWRDFSTALKNYSDDLIEKYQLPNQQTFPTWFATHQEQLSKNATQRDLNGIVAVHLLPVFNNTPEAWQTLAYLNIGRSNEPKTFDAFMQAWHDNTPQNLRHHVTSIRTKLNHPKTPPAKATTTSSNNNKN